MAPLRVAAAGIAACAVSLTALLVPGMDRRDAAPVAATVQPLAFEPSAGRFGSAADYVVRGSHTLLAVRSSGSVLALAPGRVRLGVTLAGARHSAAAVPGARLPGRVNWYAGRDRSKWRTGLPTFAAVTYRGVYPGVDLRYSGHGGRLEYDFVVGSRANPARIAMLLSGATTGMRIARNGDLVMRVGGQSLRQLRPVAYQQIGGRRVPVAAQFNLQGNRVTFTLGAYDHARPLVIDPVLAYSDYFGGSAYDNLNDVATDSAHDAVVAGSTSSSSIPGFSGGASGASIGVVAKVGPDGSRQWATFLADTLSGVAVDGSDNVAVSGTQYKAISSSSGNDGVLARLGPDGSLSWTRLIGGTGADTGDGVAADRAGDIWILGNTNSASGIASGTGFKSTLGGGSGYDAFLAQYTPSGVKNWGTYMGGSSTDGDWGAVGVSATCQSNCPVFVGGYSASGFQTTSGTDRPAHSTAYQDGFVARISATGGLDWATYTPHNPVPGCTGGVECSSNVYGIAVSPSGNPTAVGSVGQTNSTSQAWLSTYIGSSGARGPNPGENSYPSTQSGYFHDVAYDAQGNAYAIGETNSNTLRTQSPVQPSYAGGTRDAFAMKLGGAFNDSSVTIWTSYLGATGDDIGRAIAPDGNGGVYLVGSTDSVDFPSAGSRQGVGGGGDAFIARIDIKPPAIKSGPTGTLRSHDAAFTYGDSEPGATYQCRITGEAAFSACSNNGKTYTGLPDGNYTFEVRGIDQGGTPSAAASQQFTVNTQPLATFTIAPNPVLAGRSATFDAAASTGGDQPITDYAWDLDGNGTFERDTGTVSKTGEAFPKAGVIPIGLKITTASGATATTTQNLTVTASTGPAQFGVTINNGAQYTRTPDVTVTSNFPASTSDLLFSNDGGFLAPQDFPAAKTIKWKLDSSGPERLPKIVYVRFLNGPIVSETHTDDIILDETPPKVEQAQVAPANGSAGGSAAVASAARLRTWKVKAKAKDSNSGVSKLQITPNKKRPGRAVKYRTRLKVKSAKRPGWIRARDRAGNWSKWKRAR